MKRSLFCSELFGGSSGVLALGAATIPASCCRENSARISANNAKEWFQKGQGALQEQRSCSCGIGLPPGAGARPKGRCRLREPRRDRYAAEELGSGTSDLKKAETLSPSMSGIRLNIGLVQFRRGNYPEAVPVLESVVATSLLRFKHAIFWGFARSSPKILRGGQDAGAFMGSHVERCDVSVCSGHGRG